MKLKVLFFLLLPSLNVFGDDIVCPYEMPKKVSVSLRDYEEKPISDNQIMAVIDLYPEYRGRRLDDVSVVVGSWVFGESGKVLSSPAFIGSLLIRGGKKPSVKFTSDLNSYSRVTINYGGDCGYLMELKVGVGPNKK